jgi:plastocyanin
MTIAIPSVRAVLAAVVFATFLTAASALLGIAVAALVTAASAQAAGVEVKIDNFTFAPQKLTVKAGDTVTWTNSDDIPHTVTSDTRVFKSKALDTDDKFSFTFATPGTYPYFCSLHPHMSGSVVVESSNGK